NVELTNMQLKPEALNALKLPIKVKAGFLGSVKLKVPWSRIGQEPVLVYLDRIYLLAEPETQIEGYSEDAVQKTKSRIHDMEMKMLESRQILTTEMNKSWLGSFINTIIGNLKLSISSIHIRYEDLESNPGHPFAAGVTLEKLSASTVDDSGKEAFVTGGALDILQKSVELEKLAVYGTLQSHGMIYNLQNGISFGTKDGKPANALVQKHTYVLQPVTGNAKYSKQRSNSSNRDQPLQKAAVSLDDVTISLSKLADNFSAFNQRLKYAHLWPLVPVKSDPRSWWKYACRVVSDQIKKASSYCKMSHLNKLSASFLLDMDIAAPKITIPMDFSPDNRHSTKFLLDLGNLIIRTQENSVKQGKKMLSSSFKLNHLEKNDTLWCCPTSDGKQFWLSIGADASVLQSELNSPVYDWKISVNAPLKLENRLPCPAQFTIWEKWMEVGKGMMLTSAKKCPTFAGWCDIKASAEWLTLDLLCLQFMLLQSSSGFVMLLQSSSGFVMLAIYEFNYCGYIGRGKQGSCLAGEIFLLGGAFLVCA
ncbi:pleckstrin domain superfamily protein, partial [Tanacetum coccineum]